MQLRKKKKNAEVVSIDLGSRNMKGEKKKKLFQ